MNHSPSVDHIATLTSDQDLVDLYETHAPAIGAGGATPDATHIQHAAAAAHALEMRGYVEQAGIWMHLEKPHLRATA